MVASELAVLYVVIGSGCAVAFLLLAKGKENRVVDAAILVPFWPLYGPFLLVGRSVDRSLVPLDMIAPLTARLNVAKARITEIDRLLGQPELDIQTASARLDQLRAQGDDRAASSVQARLTSIERLQRMRERFQREVTEIDELLVQLRVQSEVIRFAGVDANTRELMEVVVSRVEGLDAMLTELES